MTDAPDPNQLITITLERWRWGQALLCFDHYAAILRGNLDDHWGDAKWANQLDAMTEGLRRIVANGGNVPDIHGVTS